ncbi:hypothetical protein EES40_15120 [Streptomyces sp. ADI93-02]|nr:hypothetical protein EES40_15120 [Streptomyces sp. ADI93-02]
MPGLLTKAIAVATTPQLIMMRVSHTLAPNRSMSMLEGTSKRAYAMKKMPAPSPNAAADRPTSARSWSWAKPRLTRSM